jgi:polyhydroxyalkanoate synthase subunit PhaC
MRCTDGAEDRFMNVIALPKSSPQSAPSSAGAAKSAVPPAGPAEIPMEHDTSLDRLLHAYQSRVTSAMSPAALVLAFTDWMMHFAAAPGHRAALAEKGGREWMRLMLYLQQHSQNNECEPCVKSALMDRRFSHAAWKKPPYNAMYQSFLLLEQWWHDATTGLPGVSPSHERMVEFTVRQMLDVFSPANFPWLNPVILKTAAEQGGQNFVRGLTNFVEDQERTAAGRGPIGVEDFLPGQKVAVSPGKVVYRNELIELIQYAPSTETVRPEPVLIIPAWIMKFYILDLSQQNSMVKQLVADGFTVFMISWRNPGAELRDYGMEDYRRLGVEAALKAINAICPDQKIHTAGYCLGGTMLSIAAAQMARDEDNRLASVTLLAAQTDFTEAGELMLFINDAQVAYLEDIMWEKGYLDCKQMSGAFQLLRSNDLIWSQIMRMYMLGERSKMTDLMAWNADATRMPYRMHSEYLRHMFVNNDLAAGRYMVAGRPIAISDIRVPIFAVGTETDHVAPWKSVYKIHLLADTDVTFLLCTGGHNVGILGLGERRYGIPSRSYHVGHRPAQGRYHDADAWLSTAERCEGSWWPAWSSWMAERCGAPVAPPQLGAPQAGFPALCDAPGTYVFEQ